MKKSIILSLLTFMSISLNAQTPVKDSNGDYWYTTGRWDGGAMLVKDPINKDGYTGEVVIPDVVTLDGVEYKVTAIGERAFCGCKILSVTMGNNVSTIGEHAFSYSTVASAIIGGEIDESLGASTYIGDFAFYACDNLTSVVIGDNVNNIGWQVFQNCSSLASVVLGKKVRWIGASAFFGCKNLKDVYCLGDYSPYESARPYFDKELARDMSLHVPEAAASNYSSSTWSSFGEKETMENGELTKCAMPEISYANGTISFSCATEGVEYNSSVEYVENEFNNVSEYPAPSHFRVKAVAVKKGYLPSDVAEQEFALESYVDVNTGGYKDGDVNKDSNVNVADHVRLTNIIFEKAK